jgi:anaerobic magnesium-protoporphyrin IX monomethyl ester cyclase
MLRVLLLNPPPVKGIRFTRESRCQEQESILGTVKPPLTLAILASILRNEGFEIKLIDATIERLSVEKIQARLSADEFCPEIIVFPTTTPTIDEDMQCAQRLCALYPARLVTFGPHTSALPERTLREYPLLDAVLIGEPEASISAYCREEAGEAGRAVDGIFDRARLALGEPAIPGRVKNMNKLPYPAWDLLPVDQYRIPFTNEPYLMVEISRGCPPACDFCVVPITHGKSFRSRNAVAVVDEIEQEVKTLGIRNFYLWADTVTMRKSFLVEFCQELARRNLDISWMGNSRIDTLDSLELVQQLKASGCWLLSFGVELADDDIRSGLSKNFSRERILKVFGWLKEAKILSLGFFIIGYLGETLDSMEQTIRLALETDPDFAAFYPAVPYPGTPFFDECERQGWIGTYDWSRYQYSDYVISNHVLTYNNVMGIKKKAYRSFYLRPKVIARSIRLVKSPKAIQQAVSLVMPRFGFDEKPSG